jgi:colicin import membrane protein
MVTYMAKVGAWEAALAAMTLKDTARACESPIGSAVTRSLADPEGLLPVSPLARTVDCSGGGGSGGIAPLERALDGSGDAHCGGGDDSPARRPARLEDAGSQTDSDWASEMDGEPGLEAAQKLRFRERRGLLHKSMSNLQQRGELAGLSRSQQQGAFSQSALAVLTCPATPCEIDEAGWVGAVVKRDLVRLVAELADARREAAKAVAWMDGAGLADSDRRAAAEAALGKADESLRDSNFRLADALRRADAAGAQEVAARVRAREAEARADYMAARVAGLEAARWADDDQRHVDAGARALAAKATAAALAAGAREAGRRTGELVARVDALEREAVERQLDDNYVQAVSAERAKGLERDKTDLEARLGSALAQATTAEAAAAAADGRVRELERRCAELVGRAEAAERAQSQGSTAVVSPQQEASGAWSQNDEQLGNALHHIRIYEVERVSAALLLEDLSSRYDEAAAALTSGSAELERTQAVLRCEQRISEQLRCGPALTHALLLVTC